MIEKQQLINWLKKHNTYNSYMRNFNGNKVLSDKIFLTFDEFFDYYQTEPRKLLLRAFYWQKHQKELNIGQIYMMIGLIFAKNV